jgi:hypothetical protein
MVLKREARTLNFFPDPRKSSKIASLGALPYDLLEEGGRWILRTPRIAVAGCRCLGCALQDSAAQVHHRSEDLG